MSRIVFGFMLAFAIGAYAGPKLPSDYQPQKIFTLINDPSILQELEQRGYAFQSHLGLDGRGEMTNLELTKGSFSYVSITEVLEADLNDLLTEERGARGKNSVGVGIKYPHRLFDQNWFHSSIANYQLVGVMNRLDRVAFNRDSCGELRFVYRLGYDQGSSGIQSRLPMTLLVKYTVAGKSYPAVEWEQCKDLISRWTYPNTKDPKALVDWMVSDQGPLAKKFFTPQQLHSIEVNLQALRIPSTMRPEFGGHGNYLLRVFEQSGNKFVPAVLENTPDVNKILKDPALHQKLKNLMKDRKVLNRIDNGIWNLPKEFLATKAYSYSPMGLDRQDNRLFNKLLTESDFLPQHFEHGTRYVKTPNAAIRRLNDLSCVGCHQGRATAGFHFLGIDRSNNHDINSLLFEGSGHFQLETKRRQRYFERAFHGLVPDPGRDFSFAPIEGKKAGYAHFCGLPGSKSFGHWQCEDGLQCIKIDGAVGEKDLGKCFPKILEAGAPCSVGEVTQTNHRKDTLTNKSNLTCGNSKKKYSCAEIKGGFPSGMCSTSCKGGLMSGEICAQVAGPNFTQCLIDKRPFEECFADASLSGRGSCDENNSCRNDYVCVRTKGSKKGNCTPSYFVFQIRLDGHPDPQ